MKCVSLSADFLVPSYRKASLRADVPLEIHFQTDRVKPMKQFKS
jgi:hypothetical protein